MKKGQATHNTAKTFLWIILILVIILILKAFGVFEFGQMGKSISLIKNAFSP